MKKRRLLRHALVLGALLLVVIVSVQVYLNLPRTVKEISEEAPLSEGTDLELTDVSFTETEDGAPVWSLESSRANYSKSGRAAVFEEIEVVFWGEDKQERARLTADSGTANLETREILAHGNVHMLTAEGAKFRTDELRYQHIGKVLQTDNVVDFDYLGAKMQGKGMIYSLKSQKLEILSSVTGSIPVKDRSKEEGQ